MNSRFILRTVLNGKVKGAYLVRQGPLTSKTLQWPVLDKTANNKSIDLLTPLGVGPDLFLHYTQAS